MELANVAAESIMKLTKENEALAPMIKKLQEENEKLKNDLRLCGKGLIPKDLIQRGIVEELKKENEQLELRLAVEREENELKKDAWCPELILKDLYENTNYKDPSITIKEYIQKIEAENEDLKSQIPDKKGKKLSQKDKQLLAQLLPTFSNPVNPGDWVEHCNLLKRLMK